MSMFHRVPDLNLFKAIIFDFDGVLVDSEKAQLKAWKWALSKYGQPIEPDKLLRSIGMKDEAIVEYLITGPDGGSIRTGVLEAKIWKTDQMYQENKIRPITGVLDLIERKKESHILSIATNSRSNRAQNYCESLNIRHYFQSIVTGKGKLRPKPFPDIYLKVLDTLSLPPEKCIVIEDSLIGLAAAQKAGIPCIGLADILDPETLAGHADWVIQKFDELE